MSITSASPGREALPERPFRPGGQTPRRRGALLRRARAGGAAGALIALGLAVSGCSSSVKGEAHANLVAGKVAFVSKCGSCHTLGRAETKGIVGPDLDESFRASLAEGLERSSVRGTVEEQIKIPNPEGAMPKDLVTG